MDALIRYCRTQAGLIHVPGLGSGPRAGSIKSNIRYTFYMEWLTALLRCTGKSQMQLIKDMRSPSPPQISNLTSAMRISGAILTPFVYFSVSSHSSLFQWDLPCYFFPLSLKSCTPFLSPTTSICSTLDFTLTCRCGPPHVCQAKIDVIDDRFFFEQNFSIHMSLGKILSITPLHPQARSLPTQVGASLVPKRSSRTATARVKPP